MHIDQVGRRLYVVDSPFVFSTRLRELGCHWDPNRRQWWIGVTERKRLVALVQDLGNPIMVPTPGSREAAKVVGLDPDTPAAIVADKLEEEGRTREAEKVRHGGFMQRPAREVPLYGKGVYLGRPCFLGYPNMGSRMVKVYGMPRADGTYFEKLVPITDVQVAKYYRPRFHHGVEYPMTLGRIYEFVEAQKLNAGTDQESVQCVECGAWHARGEACSQCPGS